MKDVISVLCGIPSVNMIKTMPLGLRIQKKSNKIQFSCKIICTVKINIFTDMIDKVKEDRHQKGKECT